MHAQVIKMMTSYSSDSEVSATARSISLDLNTSPCDERAPLKHIMDERRREKLWQHRIQAIVAP